ncbi:MULTISPECIES: hypothetical protein [Haloarcula]|uniref:hypothetical protein n=1 Tax=Haloarcula TaxID=2237 RepID=UPI0023E89456|nr:hypothetical protein [Halomicroarcula sp. SHR3]
MATKAEELRAPEAETDECPTVTAHKSHTERTVFTESGNKEGWIATDLTVELWR